MVKSVLNFKNGKNIFYFFTPRIQICKIVLLSMFNELRSHIFTRDTL